MAMARVCIRGGPAFQDAVAAVGIAVLELGLERGVREPKVASQNLVGFVEHALNVGLRLIEDQMCGQARPAASDRPDVEVVHVADAGQAA
jgi:hypothetical protein